MFVRDLLAAQVLAQTGDTLTAGRLWSLVGGVLGLVAVVVGGVASARAVRRKGFGKAAVVAGLVGAVIGALVVAAAEGGPGTGYGIVGGYVALAVGVVGAVLGGLALSRVRRTGGA